MGKLEYNPNIYVTDIETTDIEEGAVLYLGSMASINLSDNFKNINYSNIEEKARFHGFYRTYNELDEMLIDINNSGYKTVILFITWLMNGHSSIKILSFVILHMMMTIHYIQNRISL